MEKLNDITGKTKKYSKKRKHWVRTAVQIFFFVLVFVVSLGNFMKESGSIIPFLPQASLHAICPFGGVVSIYSFITSGSLVQKIHDSSLILMVLGIILAIGFGPIFCGWVCPFGTFQEWLSKIGKKLLKSRYNHIIPGSIDKYLRFTRYIVLVLVVLNTALTAKLIFQDVDPYYALFNFFTGDVALAAYIILGITILSSLVIERPWCKYACPYGAFLGIFNIFRIFKIKRNTETCAHCRICDRSCPMNIEVSEGTTVNNHQCISCMKCTSEVSCPVKDTVELRTGGAKL